jgi:protoporphyrinogen oxidase
LNKLWTWFPEEKYSFYRISEPKNVIPGLGPEDVTQLTVEIACDEGDDVWNADPEEFSKLINRQICNAYRIPETEFVGYYTERKPYVYPKYLRKYDELRHSIQYQSPVENMFWGGRVGQFRYIFLEECHTIGKHIARLIKEKHEGKSVPSDPETDYILSTMDVRADSAR